MLASNLCEKLAVIRRAWCEVLCTDRIGVRDKFQDIGGDSLDAVTLSRLLRTEGLEVSPADIFVYQTPEELAEACAGLGLA